MEIYCKNNGVRREYERGIMLTEVFQSLDLDFPGKPICALVNNKIEGLKYRVYNSKQVEFLNIDSEPGRKVYMRSMTFVLYKAVEELFPKAQLTVVAPASHGYFFKLKIEDDNGEIVPVTLEISQRLKHRMSEIISEQHHFHRIEAPTEDVARLFRERHLESKAKLIEGTAMIYSHYYRLDNTIDYYYGPLVPSTDFLADFDLVKYYDGLLLRIPNHGKFPEIVKQEKMLRAFDESHKLLEKGGVTTIGELNVLTRQGLSGYAIMVAEALQEKQISKIAEQIADHPSVKVVLVAGPSSSGKTTFSKRLCIQLMACGRNPRLISLDDYFVDRDKTPIDENGEFDYESIYALNLEKFQDDLTRLLSGEEVELPVYNFVEGRSEMSGKKLHLDPSTVLVMEGIHGLNPLLSENIPEECKFRIYVSALTSIKLDSHNYIPPSDNRLIRRIVRDHKYRGASAIATIARWPSVRRGEERWIFPFQENADVMFNSALIYELAVLRDHALPLLESVGENRPEHTLADALSKFLRYIEPISDKDLPPTSLLREFLGGSSFKY